MSIGNGFNLGFGGLGGYGRFEYDFSSMYPNNWLGVQNDTAQCNYIFDVQRLEQQAKQLQYFTDALQKQQQAAMTQQWQDMSNLTDSNLSVLNGLGGLGLGFGLDFTKLLNFGQTGNNNNLNTPVRRTAESKIVEHLGRMASGIMVADRINQTIEIPDGEGGKKEVKIVDRLKELVEQYRSNPDDPVMSKKNFEKVWDIVSRYDAYGDISSDDFATLKKIALNPLTDVDAADDAGNVDDNGNVDGNEDGGNEDAGNDDGDNNTPQVKQRPDGYQKAIGEAQSGIQNNYKMLANEFNQKLYNGDATEDNLNEITRNMNKYNILNAVQEFNKEYGHMKEENLIDAIFADTTRWGTGSGIFGEGDLISDDAKPSVTKLSDLLIERTNDMIKNNPDMDSATKKDLTAKSGALRKALSDVEVGMFNGNAVRGMFGRPFGIATFFMGQDITKDNKKAISDAFQSLADSLEKFEKETYGDPEDYNLNTPAAPATSTDANNPA